MKAARLLHDRLAAGKLTLGCILTMDASINTFEMVHAAGFDYVIVDLEHLTHDHTRVAELCSIGRMLDFPILLRPQNTQRDTVMMFADLGPAGFLFPMITDVADLDRIQSGLHMPPRGERRPGGRALRWCPGGDVTYPSVKANMEDELFVIAQVESPDTLPKLDAIAAHPLVSAMGMGPYDMSARLGCCWEPENPALLDAKAQIRAAGDRAGKPTWMIGDGQGMLRDGYHFQCVTEPMFLLQHTLNTLVAGLREGADEAPSGSGNASDKPFVP